MLIIEKPSMAELGKISAAKKMMEWHGLIEYLTPKDCLKHAIDQCKKPIVKFSGGKASLVVLHQAILLCPDINVMFNNTGVEMPGTAEYIHDLVDKWHLNYSETQPLDSFWNIVQKHGFPETRLRGDKRKRIREETGISKKATPVCCSLLKERPSETMIKTMGGDCVIDGIQASESRNRTFLIGDFGMLYFAKSKKRWSCHPIGLWSDADVWQYIHKNNLPYHPAYDRGYKRTGCLPCTGYLNWKSVLAKCDPKMLNLILTKQGNPGLLRYLQSKQYMEKHPPCGANT